MFGRAFLSSSQLRRLPGRVRNLRSGQCQPVFLDQIVNTGRFASIAAWTNCVASQRLPAAAIKGCQADQVNPALICTEIVGFSRIAVTAAFIFDHTIGNLKH